MKLRQRHGRGVVPVSLDVDVEGSAASRATTPWQGRGSCQQYPTVPDSDLGGRQRHGRGVVPVRMLSVQNARASNRATTPWQGRGSCQDFKLPLTREH